MNTQTPPRYQVYLLRLWQEQATLPEHSALWRFSLEDPKTGQRCGFNTLDALVTFLSKSLAMPSPDAGKIPSEKSNSFPEKEEENENQTHWIRI